MSLADALEFVRNTDREDWDRMIAEMKNTLKQRDLAAARKLTIGEAVVFNPPNSNDRREGRIIRIARERVVLAIRSQEGEVLERISVPASLVHRVTLGQSGLRTSSVGINWKQITPTRGQRLTMLGAVSVGATFVYRMAEFLGPDYPDNRKPSFEGQPLTVVDFKPRYVNQVVVEDPSGCQSLLPLGEVEKALRSQSVTPASESSASSNA
jgi:hypothetical protein